LLVEPTINDFFEASEAAKIKTHFEKFTKNMKKADYQNVNLHLHRTFAGLTSPDNKTSLQV